MVTPQSNPRTCERPPQERTSPSRAAELRLQQSGYTALLGVRCEFESGVLILRGQVPTYYLKQVAQALATEIEGVGRLHNEIEVLSRKDRDRRHASGMRFQ